MRQSTLRSITVTALILTVSISLADEVLLTDGSKIIGQVEALTEGKLHVTTDFAGEIIIDAAKIKGITTDKPLSVELKSGDRAVGPLSFTPRTGQAVKTKALGPVNVEMETVTAVWPQGDASPTVVALREQLNKLQNPWSVTLALGIDGQSGNTDRTVVNGRLDIKRTIDNERLFLYGQGRFSHENGQDTVKEVLGGATLEVDIDEQWFVFGRGELEFDKFENLDLRSRIAGGFGYFVIKQPEEELKLRGGIGFQHESFNTGVSDDLAVADLGWDYRKDIAPWLQFNHSVTLLPAFEDINQTRIIMDNAAEIPLNPDKNWKLRVGVRNEYDSMPEPGIKRLDNFYYLNIAWQWQ